MVKNNNNRRKLRAQENKFSSKKFRRTRSNPFSIPFSRAGSRGIVVQKIRNRRAIKIEKDNTRRRFER